MDQTMWLIYLHRASSSPPMTNKCSPSRASQLLTGYFSSGSIRRASPKINRQYSAILACCFGLRARRKELWGFFFHRSYFSLWTQKEVSQDEFPSFWNGILNITRMSAHMHTHVPHTCSMQAGCVGLFLTIQMRAQHSLFQSLEQRDSWVRIFVPFVGSPGFMPTVRHLG